MYRESVALTIQGARPSYEVLLGPVELLDGQVESFRPHLIVCSDDDGVEAYSTEGVLCRIEILFTDSMGARVRLDGEVWEIEDMSTKDLFSILDRIQEMIPNE